MHKIIKSHLNSFVKSRALENISESEQFELFCNYSVVFNRVGADFDPADVTTSVDDDGIDGVAVIIDEEICISQEDGETIFETERKNHDVEIVFTQAKTSDSFDLGDFLKFRDAVLRFIEEDNYLAADEILTSAQAIYNTCLAKVPKIRGGKPNFSAYYITTGSYESPTALETARKKFEKDIRALGYFNEIDVTLIGRDELTRLWVQTYSGISAALPVFSSAPLPSIAGVDEAYLVVAKAIDIVNELLKAEDGGLRTQVFEENVRSFLGADNPVNTSIAETLSDPKTSTRFPVMNNGITIVSPDVRVQGSVIHLENFQIVNGCQTSNMLFEHRDNLNDAVMVNLKIVETSNEDVFADLVRATNSQSKIDENQFYSLRPIVKRIEQYFNAYEGSDSRLYFERRDRQFIGLDIPAIRIFSVYTVAKCISAVFLRRPDLSYKYPKRMYEQLGETIFAEKNKEIIYYASALALYRFHLLRSNSVIPQNLGRMKWHIISLVGAIISGNKIPELNSRKTEAYCQKLIDTLSKHDQSIKPFKKAVEICNALAPITDDRLKRQAILEEMLNKI